MKNFRYYLIAFLTISLFFSISCSKEDILDIVDNPKEEAVTEEETKETETNEESEENQTETPPQSSDKINATPCDFTLNNITANTTVVINCTLDLQGETITLPSNVTIDFDGGEIKNGTIVFNGGVIDGRILNHTLTVKGDATLKDPIFVFDPARWDIVQGKVDDSKAQNNTNKFESLIFKIHELGGTTFSIDSFDAYFYTTRPSDNIHAAEAAINIPSNFHLKMSNNTHIRKQPNNYKVTILMGIYKKENVKVSGGNLHGDRDEHDYSDGGTHEWGTGIAIVSSNNSIIENVTITDMGGDGINIYSATHYYSPNYLPSKNIYIKNNILKRSRRTNLVITSAEYVYIEDNTFIDGGISTNKSFSTPPSADINIEPHRSVDSNGNLIEYEKVHNVFIRNNKQYINNPETQSQAGGFLLSVGNGPIIAENNTLEKGSIGYYHGDGIIIRNNEILNGNIYAGNTENFDRLNNFGNEVYGNTITNNDGVGLEIHGRGNKVYNNTIIDSKVGIKIMDLADSEIYSNNIKSNNNGMLLHGGRYENIIIRDNTIEMYENKIAGVIFYGTNKDLKTKKAIIFSGNKIYGKKNGNSYLPIGSSITNAHGIEFLNNNFGKITISKSSSNINFQNNKINTINTEGIFFEKKDGEISMENSSIIDNTIILDLSNSTINYTCFVGDIDVKNNNVLFSNNSCEIIN